MFFQDNLQIGKHFPFFLPRPRPRPAAVPCFLRRIRTHRAPPPTDTDGMLALLIKQREWARMDPLPAIMHNQLYLTTARTNKGAEEGKKAKQSGRKKIISDRRGGKENKEGREHLGARILIILFVSNKRSLQSVGRPIHRVQIVVQN